MIRVVRIAGESFDLETKKELPKSLVLSNGTRELSVYVDDDTAAEVLKMMLEGTRPDTSTSTRPALKRAPEPVPIHTFEKPTQARSPVPVCSNENGRPTPSVVAEGEEENGGLEPGEEYDDPATGAGSL